MLLAAGTLAACDLGVRNPAAIDDMDLDSPQGVIAIANGVGGAFGHATTIPGGGGVYTASALLTDELVHVGSWQPLREISEGAPSNASPENQSHWGFTSEARWMAEDAVDRISRLVQTPGTNPTVAMVALYAGFSNRLMGDMFCNAVIDGGPLEPHTAFHNRAVNYFNRAIEIASAAGHNQILAAAYGGRAQARMMLGDWQGAIADAGRVPTNFQYLQIHSENSVREYNGLHRWAALGFEGRQLSVWGTPFAEWGTEINNRVQSERDPRVRFEVVQTTAGAPVFGGDGRRPIWYAHRYTGLGSDIPIVKGTEMRLIEAEARLVAGDWQGALAQINVVRTFRNLPPLTATSVATAWPVLMKERGIELWLEGRRLPDLRRWATTPGAVPFSVVRQTAGGQPSTQDPRRNVLEVETLCLRISTNELNSNPNL
jgi:starch-binding outer membrane protein, SusD/RagB family